jgi:hypothetical protein
MDISRTTGSPPWYRIAIMAIGALCLLGGIAVGALGPIEMYCFYLFSEGGRFHYEGFGFGSFMFGNIASQIIGYYLIAGILIPLGYGHLARRRWVRPLSVTLLWSWLVVGAPLVVVVFIILAASKDLSWPAALAAIVLLGLSYLVFPGLLIRFYQSRQVRQVLEAQGAEAGWLERRPIPILVLSCLYAFYIIMLHILIMFNGIYPVFGAFRFGLEGIVLLDISIVCLVGLIWGTLRQRVWAWWGGVVFWGLFTFSTILTFVRTSYPALLSGLAFPPREMEMLGGVPAQGYHFAILAGIPLVITWIVAVLSKRHYKS